MSADRPSMSADRQGELPIQYVLLAIWRFRAVAAVVFAACMLVAIVYLQLATRYYIVSMSVTAVDEGGQNRSNNALSQGLALLGADAQSDQGNLFSEYLEGIHSTETARVLLGKPDLMHHIFSTNWSPESKEWVQPHGFAISLKNIVKVVLGIPAVKSTQPNAQLVSDFLEKNISVEKDKEDPVVKVSIMVADPQLGLDVLNAVHETADGVLRQRTLARTSSYIDYLNKKLQQATIVEYRQGIADAIVDQEKVRMKADSVLPFAADLFARPSVSTLPTKPSALGALLTAAVLGLVFGIFLAILCNRLDFDPFVFWRLKWHKFWAQFSHAGRTLKQPQ